MEEEAKKDNFTAKTPAEFLIYTILNKRLAANHAIENYEYNAGRGVRPRIHPLRAKTCALYYEIRPAMKADKSTDNLNKIERYVRSLKYANLRKALDMIDDWLYKKQVLKFDNKGGYDFTDLGEVLKNNRH